MKSADYASSQYNKRWNVFELVCWCWRCYFVSVIRGRNALNQVDLYRYTRSGRMDVHVFQVEHGMNVAPSMILLTGMAEARKRKRQPIFS